MKEKNREIILMTIDGLIVAGVLALVCLFIATFIGCAHDNVQVDCVPSVKTVVVPTYIRECPTPPPVPRMQLPEWPIHPGENAEAEELKGYYADMALIARERERILNIEINTLNEMLEEYRQ